MAVTGGSGKDFSADSDGNITINYEDGSSRTCSKGDADYEKTKDAMESDTGKSLSDIQNSSNSSSSSSSNRGGLSSISDKISSSDKNDILDKIRDTVGSPDYSDDDDDDDYYRTPSANDYEEGRSYLRGDDFDYSNVTYDSNGRGLAMTDEGAITVVYKDGTNRVIYPGESGYSAARIAYDAVMDSKNLTNPSTAAAKQYLTEEERETSNFKGDVTIKDDKGNVIEVIKNAILQDGAFYDPDTGEILSSVHTGIGVYDESMWDKEYYRDENGVAQGVFIYKGSTSAPSGGGGGNPPTPPPCPPPFVEFNKPVPTFESDLKKINKYSYYFGIDNLKVKNVKINETCCFISKTIYLESIEEEDYIELDANYYIDDISSIEFYIIDGENEIPILPINDTKVMNEKVFFGLSTRFIVDDSNEVIIKQDSKITTYTLNDVLYPTTIDTSLNYNITYTPKTSYKYKPLNNNIKVKVIIRTYGVQEYIPYVKSIKIRKYGGSALWSQTI